MPPSAALVRSTMSCLRPSCFHLSPAGGLAAFSSPIFLSNLHRLSAQSIPTWGLAPSCELARQTFFRPTPDDPLRVTGSRSQAASYLTPSILGHMVGLSVTQADNDTIQRTLRSHGVDTNRFMGEWTGVSFARWTRLVHSLREALALGGEGSPALALALRLVWEKVTKHPVFVPFSIMCQPSPRIHLRSNLRLNH